MCVYIYTHMLCIYTLCTYIYRYILYNSLFHQVGKRLGEMGAGLRRCARDMTEKTIQMHLYIYIYIYIYVSTQCIYRRYLYVYMKDSLLLHQVGKRLGEMGAGLHRRGGARREMTDEARAAKMEEERNFLLFIKSHTGRTRVSQRKKEELRSVRTTPSTRYPAPV